MSYVSRSKSAAAEAERSEKLALELLEVFTRQPTQELRRLEMLSGLWTQVDQHINAVLEAANGREGTARMLCEFLVWRALNLWIDDDIQCGQTDAELLKEYRAKVEAAAAEPRPVRPMPMIGPCVHPAALPQSDWQRRIAGKRRPHEVRRLREQRNAIQRRYREKKRLPLRKTALRRSMIDFDLWTLHDLGVISPGCLG